MIIPCCWECPRQACVGRDRWEGCACVCTGGFDALTMLRQSEQIA